jgi:hypothetical protein
MRQIPATESKLEPLASVAYQCWRWAAARWRTIAYIAAGLPLLAMFVLARIYPDLNRPEIPDWKPVISLAGESWKEGDLYQARHLYLRAERIASRREDWDGLVAVACGLNRLDGTSGPNSKAFSILIRASLAAQSRRSRRGIATVAHALTAVGANKAATAVWARMQPDWLDETKDSDNLKLLEACRVTPQKSRGSK